MHTDVSAISFSGPINVDSLGGGRFEARCGRQPETGANDAHGFQD